MIAAPAIHRVPDMPVAPYPGLRPFEQHEWAIFFGRERMIEAVLARLAKQQFIVLHGSSGCGKSSLIRAGVLPRLQHEHSRYGARWRSVTMRPGGAPLWNLATQIAKLLATELEDDPSPDHIRPIHQLLTGGRRALTQIQERFAFGRDGNVCVLLDQFEELFRYAREIGREEAEILIQILRGFEEHAPPGIHAIVTMRSDHLGDCAQFEGFAELVNDTQYLLPRMDDSSLLRAIREPARLFNGEVSVGLAMRLVEESRGEIDALPLVQHSLMRLWQEAEPIQSDVASRGLEEAPPSGWGHALPKPTRILRDKDYPGLHEALSAHADEVLEEITHGDPAITRIVEYLFRALTEIDALGRGIRRPQRLADLVGVTGGNRPTLEYIIDRLRQPDCSFLTPPTGTKLQSDTIIDIVHEALIRCWRQLNDSTVDDLSGRPRGWLQREREDGRVWRALLVAAESYSPGEPTLKDFLIFYWRTDLWWERVTRTDLRQ